MKSMNRSSSKDLKASPSPISPGVKILPIHHGTGVTFDERMGNYECKWDKNYAEKPERFTASIKKCQEYGLFERCTFIKPRKASERELLLQHSPEHVAFLSCVDQITDEERLEELSSRFDSIRFSPNLLEAALLSVGSLIELLDNILESKITNGMAILRPPGHHASQSEACGYSYFNNVAIAAKHAINKGVERILIVDWDVHHGNGTQEMFYDDPRVLYFSIHKYSYGEYWPNLRMSDADYIGSGAGEGFNINFPLNEEGLGNEDYLAIFHHILLPVAYEFCPQLVLVSCGYDAAMGDVKGGMMLTPPFYTHMLLALMGLAENKVCVALEGGYYIDSLAQGVALTLRTLLGDPCPKIGALPAPRLITQETITDLIECLRKYWKCFTYHPFGNTESEIESTKERDFRGKYERDLRFVTRDEEECQPEIACQVGLIMKNTRLTFPSSRTCLVHDLRMVNHMNHTDKSHPEKPDRLRRIYSLHKELGLVQRCNVLQPHVASDSELELVHSKKHIELMKHICKMKPREVYHLASDFNSIYLCQSSDECGRLAVGCLLQVVDEVLSLKSRNGVAIIRPPGHHAEVDQPMGFCLYNNVAVAAKYALKKYNLSRVLILDWDVHHGNGIQHMFESDHQVLYISLHRYDNGSFFPLSTDGNYDVVGKGQGEGFTVNIPWNKSGMGDSEYLSAFFHVVLPIAYQFDPELVLISAGFDAADGDPLGGCKVTPSGYAQMTHLLSSLAEGRVIVALEGGYNLTAISKSMCSCTKVLLGDPCPPMTSPLVPNSSAMKSINSVIDVHSKYWSRLKNEGKTKCLWDEESLESISTFSSSSSSTSHEGSVEDICSGLQTVNISSNTKESKECEEASSVSNVTLEHKMFVFTNEDHPSDDVPYCVVPMLWCPHLEHHVRKVPENRFDIYQPCSECGSIAENWMCLTCYKVLCGRYVNQHMLNHCSEVDHQMTLSFSDLSVWCYGCEAYVHHEALSAVKNIAHEKKFGMSLPSSKVETTN